MLETLASVASSLGTLDVFVQKQARELSELESEFKKHCNSTDAHGALEPVRKHKIAEVVGELWVARDRWEQEESLEPYKLFGQKPTKSSYSALLVSWGRVTGLQEMGSATPTAWEAAYPHLTLEPGECMKLTLTREK